jgi:L-seryl-tRNA(Ser) seleniumtransferase
VPVVDDLGSGALVDLKAFGLETEPLVQDSLRAGADVACFSGDKLIGGPQSGIIVGRAETIQRIKRNPLARAFRCGKLTLAALEATLKLFLRPELLAERHPVYRMFALDIETLERRAGAVAAALKRALKDEAAATVEPSESQVGSGAVPVLTLPTRALVIHPARGGPDELGRRLRRASPPIFTRVADDAVWLDFRTIQPDEDGTVTEILLRALKA